MRMKKYFSGEIEILYFILMLLTYILYLTDNVNRYLSFILVFSMIPYAHYLKLKERKKNDTG